MLCVLIFLAELRRTLLACGYQTWLRQNFLVGSVDLSRYSVRWKWRRTFVSLFPLQYTVVNDEFQAKGDYGTTMNPFETAEGKLWV